MTTNANMQAVDCWLRTRADVAPAGAAARYRTRAELYELTAGMSAYDRRVTFTNHQLGEAPPELRPGLPDLEAITCSTVEPYGLLTVRIEGELFAGGVPPNLSEKIATAAKVDVICDSVGGCAATAFGLMAALVEHPNATAHIINACSAAALVALACGHRRMDPAGTMMIHAPSSFAGGTAKELQAVVDWLEKFSPNLERFLCERTGQPATVVKDWLAGDTYFDAAMALANGLVHDLG